MHISRRQSRGTRPVENCAVICELSILFDSNLAIVCRCGLQVLQEDPEDHKLALLSYSKGLGNAGAGNDNGTHGVSSIGSGVESQQAAWTNIAVLHEHMGNPVEAVAAYQHALGQGGADPKRVDDSVDSDSLLRITDPANQLFWEWKELAATAFVAKGSRMVRVSASVGGGVRKGMQIRVGDHFVSTVQGAEMPSGFEVADLAPAGIEGADLEGPLFKKISKTRIAKDNVSVVFNLALLHEKQGHHEAAQELHKAVLAEHPTYVHSKCSSETLQAGFMTTYPRQHYAFNCCNALNCFTMNIKTASLECNFQHPLSALPHCMCFVRTL